MTVTSSPVIDAVVRDLMTSFAETASERDKKGGTAKEQRDLIRQSDLLGLLTPKELGGYGHDLLDVLAITKKIAQVDSSLAHLFGYHFLCLATVDLYGTEKQFQYYAQKTADDKLFWGNAFNPLDTNVNATKTKDGWEINGIKSFCSGASDADLLLVSAQKVDNEGLLIALIPTKRTGLVILNDWDSFGQRQTDSGNVQFEGVAVFEEEVLTTKQQSSSIDLKSSIRTHIAQSILNHVLLGTAEGAFQAAKEYTQSSTRSWLTSGVQIATEDPYYIHHYGEWFVKLQAANALAQIANEKLQATWDNRQHLTMEQRGECSIAVATAKVQIVKTALEVTSGMFEVMGARATSAKYNFDRYWRNVRTHTLHDPIAYKLRDIGDFALNRKYPQISPYS
ncbi:acyl-CoA dehydrogenase family protein [Metasolibacillus meyeri]|uniref:acyl-CoA dehydrogenase family protein n=1 Tax=Metasolibacillus meyeri TaxID=1071052 RepID=UPI001EE69DAE|nr:acyl-CoA dehydrogenase family protein [Metasolibacillus meyeri]